MRLSNSLLALALLLPPAAVAGPVYRHVDDRGNVSYSDQPPAEGSAEMELPEINRYSGSATRAPGTGTEPEATPGGMPPGGVPPPDGMPAPADASAGGSSPPLPAPLPALAPIQYQSLVITGVADGTILMNPEGSVSVSAAASPSPRADHRIVIRHNGTEVGDAGFYQAPRLDRGTHTFSAAIVDAEGNVLFQAADVSIHVQRPTLKKKKP